MMIRLTSEELWGTFSDDVLEEILARLPSQSLALTSCVCRRWRSIATSPAFLTLYNHRHDQESSLYVNGHKYKVSDASTKLHSHESELQSRTFCSPHSPPSGRDAEGYLWGPGGICFTLLGESLQQKIRYKVGTLSNHWLETPPIKHPRSMPIVGIIKNPSNLTHKLVCAGGTMNDGIQLSSLKVELFSLESQSWEECEDLPVEFGGKGSLMSVTYAICNDRLFVLHIYSGKIAAFDVGTRKWSDVKILRPWRVRHGYLVGGNRELLLIGVNHENDQFVFRGWRVDIATMECTGEPRPVICHFTNTLKKTSFRHTELVQTENHSSSSLKLDAVGCLEARRRSLALQYCLREFTWRVMQFLYLTRSLTSIFKISSTSAC